MRMLLTTVMMWICTAVVFLPCGNLLGPDDQNAESELLDVRIDNQYLNLSMEKRVDSRNIQLSWTSTSDREVVIVCEKLDDSDDPDGIDAVVALGTQSSACVDVPLSEVCYRITVSLAEDGRAAKSPAFLFFVTPELPVKSYAGYTADGVLSSRWTTNYGPQGRSEQVFYDANENIKSKMQFVYSGKNITEAKLYNPSGVKYGYHSYVYDTSGNLARLYSYLFDLGKITMDIYYSYDEQGRVKTRMRYDVNGALTQREKLEYDALGRLARRAFLKRL